MPKSNVASEKYTETLEKAKKQYKQYLEVSELYKLPIAQQQYIVQVVPPSPKHPLTTNTTVCLD